MRTPRSTTTHRTRSRAGLRAAAPAALVVGLVLAGCADDGADPGVTTDPGVTQTPQEDTATPSPTGSGERVELTALLGDSAVYDGQLVTTSGILATVAPGVVQLTPEGASAASPSPTDTAVSPSPTGTGTPEDGTGDGGAGGAIEGAVYVLHTATELPQDGTTATVTGTVRFPFDAAAVEDALGITVDQETLDGLQIGDADVVIVAEMITGDGGMTDGGTDGGTESPTPTG